MPRRRLRTTCWAAAILATASLCVGAETYHPVASHVETVRKVDDFDVAQVSGLFSSRRNALDGYHGTWAQRPSYVTMHTEHERRWGTNGTSLRLEYKQDVGTCGWYTRLEGLDSTSYNGLRFMVRGVAGGENIRIGFRDVEMMEYEAEPVYLGSMDTYLPSGITREWQEVIVPISVLAEKMDARNLSQFVLQFAGRGEGAIIIDDLAFVTDAAVAAKADQHIPRSQSDGPRALYVWGLDPVDEPEAAARLLAFSSQASVSTLLLDMSHLHKRIHSEDYEVWLEHFLERAHAEGFQVMALAGEVGWVTEKGRREASEYIDALLHYNEHRPPQKRFDGLHLDVEVNTVATWRKEREQAKASYQDLMQKLSAQLEARAGQEHPFVFSVAVGADYIMEGYPFLDPVLQAVDEVVVMAYRDDERAILDETSSIAAWLQQKGKRMWIAVETQDLVGSSRGRPEQTFHEEGWESMEHVFQNVQDHFAGSAVYGGVAIHHYDSYRYMKRTPEGKGI